MSSSCRQAHSRRAMWLTPNRLGSARQGGSSSLDAPVRRAMPTSSSPVGLPGGICVSECLPISSLTLECVLSSILVCVQCLVKHGLLLVCLSLLSSLCRFIATQTPIIVRQLTIHEGLLQVHLLPLPSTTILPWRKDLGEVEGELSCRWLPSQGWVV